MTAERQRQEQQESGDDVAARDRNQRGSHEGQSPRH
jgi:hypothetical protein